ncbi:MAG: hypothetical protein LLG97_12600 [Deltaproteobacteria bacterium]|nr:hypothetical protein [Deltaproteobacteria bacterium]
MPGFRGFVERLCRWLFGGGSRPGDERCGVCDHFTDDPAVLEAAFKGINALSSVRGESRGDGGICRCHDRYLLPVHHCPEFRRKS